MNIVIPKENEVRICTLGRVWDGKKKFILMDRYRDEQILQESPDPKFNDGRIQAIEDLKIITEREYFMVQFTVTNDDHGVPDANLFAPVPMFESYTIPSGA